MTKQLKDYKSNKGVTLVELVVAVVILSVTILVFVGSFTNISKSVIASKAKTLATNLAQEKIQILRQMPYHRILVTPSPMYYTEVSPAVPYDNLYFPPERILEGGIYFTRYTYVYSVQEVDGEIVPLPPGSPDQGMKCIQISVVYDTAFGKKAVTLRTVETNPEIEAYRGVIQGKVRNRVNFQPIRDVLVVVAENIGCRDYTDSNGDYTIRVPFGSYNVMASIRGYFPAVVQVSVGATPQTVNFDLQPMSSGTVCGYVWLNDRIVISQVCGSTTAPNGFQQEWIELYNPTTFYWQVAVSSTQGIIGVRYQSLQDVSPQTIYLEYQNLQIPPFSYYLIANTKTVTACGITKTADAIYSSVLTLNPGYPNIIKTREDDGQQYAGGSVEIYWISTGQTIDLLGWKGNNGQSPQRYETSPLEQMIGLETDEQYVRKTSTMGFSTGWGNCYDSDTNNADFLEFRKPMQVPPKNTSDSLQPLTGRPAVGSYVTCNDGLSDVVTTFSFGSPPVAMFTLVSVATGTWSVMISSKERYMEIGNVVVSANATSWIPNANTLPAWYTPYFYTQLSSSTEFGFISGRVTNVLAQPLGGIRIQTSAGYIFTNALGYYFFAHPVGIYSVVANPQNLNPLYVSLTRENVEVKQAQITSGINFVLSQGGRVTGFVTRDGVNPLPGVVMIAENVSGVIYDEEVTDVNGRFYIANLSSGTYYIKPVLGSKETSTPAVSTVTVTAGVTVHAGTFTVRGAMGKISGKMYSSGKLISTGVLIVASTATITTPPVLSTATLTSAAYFITSSYEDGSYSIEVIGSTSTRYNVYAYYTTYTVTGIPVVTTKSRTNILVYPGQEVTGQDFNW
ncbi:MAG: carboxypeptidase regulatory-like domain-containing protein [Endomicrobia bacterium]|nr:carboxypeptidase regulatory-like domain-containing protein [Endomicrobiia bacterium]